MCVGKLFRTSTSLLKMFHSSMYKLAKCSVCAFLASAPPFRPIDARFELFKLANNFYSPFELLLQYSSSADFHTMKISTSAPKQASKKCATNLQFHL